METEKQPDLNQIQISESYFLACTISNRDVADVPVAPQQIAAYTNPQVQISPMVRLDRKQVSFEIRVQSHALDIAGEPLEVSGSFRLYISFLVENLDELVYLEEKYNQKIPTSLLTTSLIGVAYSTARGMIISKVADTVMGGFGLPLRSARQLMSESMPSDEEVEITRAKAAERLAARQHKARPEQE